MTLRAQSTAAYVAFAFVTAASGIACQTGSDGDGGSGGVSSNGGVSNGGVSSGGATSGGATTSGGKSSSGGATTSGGKSSSGGATSGGRSSSGGATSGGKNGAGGSSGGEPSSGGKSSSGGASTNGGQGNGGGGGGAGGGTHTGQWTIMPFGDSITGTTCYPQLLSQKLKADNHTNFKFIGMNLNNQNCNGAPTLMTEGHGGYLVTCLTGDAGSTSCASKGSPAELSTWAAEKPDVVLMQYGTNDVWNGIPAATITSAFSKVLTAFRAMNASAVFFVAQILPMHPNNCLDSDSSCPNARVKALNAAIPDWANSQSSTASPVYVVDIYSTVDDATYTPSSTNTDDGVHPNSAGSDKVASKWEAALLSKGIP